MDERALLSDVVDMLGEVSPPNKFLVCVFMCLFSFEACVHECVHTGHLYGFSPVCDLRWTIRLLWNLNRLPQNSHDLTLGGNMLLLASDAGGCDEGVVLLNAEPLVSLGLLSTLSIG